MEKKKPYITLSIVLLVVGLSFLVNSQANITGAVIGVSTSPSAQGFFAGTVFILFSFILFTLGISGTKEKKQDNNQTENDGNINNCCIDCISYFSSYILNFSTSLVFCCKVV